uniref:Myosin, light chain 2b, regulatory, cardiac, slow n=1 Tax=Sinocyclocheilus rhinocerous TaxID=307959 RepID=A0A673HQ62_9TELE
FSMFEQTQIQEFKEVQTKRSFDSNCSDNCLYRDSFTVISSIYSEIPVCDFNMSVFIIAGPINFTVFLTMFGEKLKGADAEETILNAFKVFDPEGKGTLRKDFAFPPDAAGNLDYKNLVYIITHGEEKNQE